MRTDFVPVDASGTKYSLTMQCPGDLPSPLSSVSEMVCFLLPNASLPPTHGLMVYWQVESSGRQTGFELLGSLTETCPSAVLRTSWSQHDQVSAINPNTPATVTIGVSFEILREVHNQSADSWDNRLFVAQKIATDLFHYMQSFDSGNTTGKLVVPTHVFDRWLKRFEARFRRDPNFFMKHQD